MRCNRDREPSVLRLYASRSIVGACSPSDVTFPPATHDMVEHCASNAATHPCRVEEQRSGVSDVWHTLRAVKSHFLWTDRNCCLFDKRYPTPVLPALQEILAAASAHFRHRLRRLYNSDQQTRHQAVLARMIHQQLFHACLRRYPTAINVLQLRF